MGFSVLSLVIPVYNVENYLETCLDSIINQTYQDIEIICVNDGSTDKSLEILEEYKKKDNRITIINKENGGLSSARNAGLDIAKGQYICFIDSDDFIEIHTCERLVEFINDKNPDVIIFGANIFPINPKPTPWLKKVLTTRNQYYSSFSTEVLFDEPGCRPFVWRNCYKLSFLRKHSLRFEENIRFGEDQIFQFIAFPRASSFLFIEDKLYNYRWIREGSLMSIYDKDKERKFKEHIAIVQCIRDKWIETGDMELMPSHFLKWSIDFIGFDLVYSRFKDKKSYAHSITQIWNCIDLDTCKNSLNKEQSEVLDYILGKASIRKKMLILLFFILKYLPKLFFCLRDNGIKYTVNRIKRKLLLIR